MKANEKIKINDPEAGGERILGEEIEGMKASGEKIKINDLEAGDKGFEKRRSKV